MMTRRTRRAAIVGVALVICLALAGWLAARQIRSPARVAAETAAPKPSLITAPVQRRTLSTEVIVRGTVRYGAPQPVVLAASGLKQAAATQAHSDIVTRPPRKGARLNTGQVAMAVDGRPVFVLPGTVPMHRDLTFGDAGPDVRQLERALAGAGYAPGRIDGRYDGATQAAVASFYLSRGYDPFGPTDTQRDQLRTAAAAAATARDAHIQALQAIEQARRTPTAADKAQARADAVTARDAVDTAVLAVTTADAKLAASRAQVQKLKPGERAAQLNAQRDTAAADADVVAKQNALNAATDEARLARMRVGETSLDAAPSEREAVAVAVRQADANVAQAQADVTASTASATAVAAGGQGAIKQARDDLAQATRDAAVASRELARARVAVQTTRSQARLAAEKARLLARPTDTAAMHALAASTAQEEARTRGDVARLSTARVGVQVPANEVVFLAHLPARVDVVKAKRGDAVAGRVMDVTRAHLAIDSSLSVSDAKLVRRGDPVAVEDPDLGIKTRGTVREVSSTPGISPAGTARVDPSRFYLGVIPGKGPSSLVGTSVKLTIAVKSTRGAVLTVPVSTLSVGGDGNARLQVLRSGRTQLVPVVPGLAARGLVEVRPVGQARLLPGDRVVVGSAAGGRSAVASVTGTGP